MSSWTAGLPMAGRKDLIKSMFSVSKAYDYEQGRLPDVLSETFSDHRTIGDGNMVIHGEESTFLST